MSSRKISRLLSVIALALLAGTSVPLSVRAQGGAVSGAASAVDPGQFKGLYYKPLTVFSRGGRVTAVAGVASNPQLYYLGSAGGVWKTDDAGAAWVPINDGQIKLGYIGAIDVAD